MFALVVERSSRQSFQGKERAQLETNFYEGITMRWCPRVQDERMSEDLKQTEDQSTQLQRESGSKMIRLL